MNEASLGSETRKVLRARGMHVIKFADRATIGIPDMAVITNTTTWIEEKFLHLKNDDRFIYHHEGKTIHLRLRAKEFLDKKAQGSQLDTMRKIYLLTHQAHYLVYVNDGKNTYAFTCLPPMVTRSVDLNEELYVTLTPVSEWRKTWLPNK